MKLRELDPQLLYFNKARWTTGEHILQHVDRLQDANGVLFVCPLCFERNDHRRIGVHSVMCWAPSVPLLDELTGPGRWELHGTSVDDLTLVAGSSSVHLKAPAGCGAHFFVRNGEITNA
jgi:hypothetical protein